MKKSTSYSHDHKYRYSLAHIEDRSKPTMLFIGYHAHPDDVKPESRLTKHLMRFAKMYSHGSFILCNFYAFITEIHEELDMQYDPIGPDNDIMISAACAQSDTIIMCHGIADHIREAEVCKLTDKPIFQFKGSLGTPAKPTLGKRADTQFVSYIYR